MPIGLLIAAFLMFIARPAGVFIGLSFFKNKYTQQTIYFLGRLTWCSTHCICNLPDDRRA
jgi:NhaP-type Na+/H+ and K+/H+ antiporter